MKKDMLIIHCSATPEGQDVTVEQIRNWHINQRHWSDIGYNYVIYRDGSLHEGRPLANGGAHTAGYNSRSIGVCYIGGCAPNSTKAKDTRTYQQNNTLYQFVRQQLIHYRDVEHTQMTVHGHYEFAAKACPSFNVEEWLKDTGLVNEFPWLVNSPNYQQYLHGQTVKREGTKGIGCSVASSNVGMATDSALKQAKYISPHKAERDELAKAVHAHKNVIYSYQNSKLVERTLLADKFYYLQNAYIFKDSDNDNIDAINKRQCVKSLLFLHSLPFNYNDILEKGFFNNKSAKHGGVELVPRGYVLLLGGLIWRKKWSEAHDNTDPVEYGYTSEDNVYHALYAKPEYPYDPLFRKDGDVYKLSYCRANGGNDVYNVPYEDFVNKDMDEYTANMLVNKFLEFVHIYAKYLEGIELKYKVTVQQGNIEQNAAHIKYIENAPTTTTEYIMDYKKMESILQTLTQSVVKNNLKTTFEYLLGQKQITLEQNQNITISGFAYNYAMGFIEDNELSLYYVEDKDNTTGGMFLYNIAFSQPLLVQTSGMNNQFAQNDGSIFQKNYKSYLDGFCNTLNYYIKQDPEMSGRIKKIAEESSANEYDFKCEIYALLKNLWDRWFCGFYNSKNETDNNFFTVGNFFNNFLFMDTFYNNISLCLRLNCRLLLEQYEGNVVKERKSGINITNHLGNVASVHRCAMFNFPDFTNFSCKDEAKVFNNLKDMFLPIPANEVGHPQIMNKFVIIYTHSAKSLSTEDRNRFVPDTFDIWSYDEGTHVAPSIYNYNPEGYGDGRRETDPNDSRMGYLVPSFGIAYSRQDNSYWKNIRVGMDSHQVTEQSARALAQIAELGNSSKKKITFYGQDLYSIYQAYSYIVTVEMMGNAQIQPLMYFQLMNVPMFRGTYMIIKVEHNITAGNMTTTFTGMKMSKVQKPFTTSWFATVNKESDGDYKAISSDADTARNGEVIRTNDGNQLDIADNRLSEVINSYVGQQILCDVFVREVYKKAFNIDISHNLAYENGVNMFNELENSGKWNMTLFKKRPRKSNNWASFSASGTHPKVGDILFGYHNGNIEGKHMHVAIYLGMHDGHHYVAEGGDNEVDKSTTNTVVNNNVQVTMIETSMMAESTDIYTHHATCSAAKIEQVEHKPETVTTTSEVTVDTSTSTGATTPPSNQINDLFIQEITTPLHLSVKGVNATQFPTSSSTAQACTQAAFSEKLPNQTFVPTGMFVTEGLICRLENYSYGGGFIYNNDGSFHFYKDVTSYVNDIRQTCGALPIYHPTISPASNYRSSIIDCAFQNFLLINDGKSVTYGKNGGKPANFLKNKTIQCHFRAIVELKNGKLALAVCDKAMTLLEFHNKLLQLNVRNAIYNDSAGNWSYGWCKVPPGTTINGETKKIINNTYYWKGTGIQNNFTWTNVLYF